MTQDEKSHKGSALTVPHLSDRTVFRVFFAISGLMFLVNVARHWTYLEDDPLIVFRYAINFHAGYGWVMNPGEHVNGCTSWFGLFAATFLSSFLSVDSAIVALKLLGIMSGLVVLWKSQQIAALLLPEAPVLSACVPLLLSYRSDFCLSMTNGLETAFACAFLFCGLAAFLTGSRDNKDKTPWETVAFFVLAGLSRPELSVIYPSLFCLQAIKKEKVDLRLLGIYLLPFLCFAVFSFTFYHSILPNTYYAKRVDIPTGLILGSNYIVRYLLAPTYFLPASIQAWTYSRIFSRDHRSISGISTQNERRLDGGWALCNAYSSTRRHIMAGRYSRRLPNAEARYEHLSSDTGDRRIDHHSRRDFYGQPWPRGVYCQVFQNTFCRRNITPASTTIGMDVRRAGRQAKDLGLGRITCAARSDRSDA